MFFLLLTRFKVAQDSNFQEQKSDKPGLV